MSGQSSQNPILDHIVVLIGHTELQEITHRLKDTFVVAPGGTHADGLTSNKLVLLEDGVYIEFIAFFDDADPELRSKHRWGKQKEGVIIDWAYTLPHEQDFTSVQQRLKDADTQFTYTEPVAGGREKEDGTIIKWSVAMALDGQGQPIHPGKLPFWCFDRTPRKLRVPYENNPKHTQHPSGVRGIAAVSVSVTGEEVEPIGAAYGALHGSKQLRFDVPSGDEFGKQTVSVSAGAATRTIELVLSGTSDSPSTIELLPGLKVKVEA